MSYTIYESRTIEMDSACKPNYESLAARKKKELDAFKEFKDQFKSFILNHSNHQLMKTTSPVEFFGAIELETEKKDIEYNNLLKQIEKNN